MIHSGYRQDNIARHADQMLRESRKGAEEFKRQQAEGRRTTDHEARMRAKQEARKQVFDQLQVGDTLECFGLGGTVVKKNPKSIITVLGVRWTRDELCRV